MAWINATFEALPTFKGFSSWDIVPALVVALAAL
jgi:hypothetical protein